jgi:hypothetical protein
MGQSAGAISVGLQLFANGGDPAGLFRAAFMVSAAVFHSRINPFTDRHILGIWFTPTAQEYL